MPRSPLSYNPITARRLWSVAFSLAAATALGAGSASAQTLTTIDYLMDRNTNAYQSMDAWLQACSEETGITFERQAVPYPELVQKVLLAATSNSLPDLIYLDNSDVPQLADGGLVAPLSEVGIELEGFVPALAALGNYKGVDYALPTANNSIALYYNIDMFEAAGIEPPTTWDELRAAAKALTQGDVYGLAFPAPNNEQATFHTSPFVWSNGGDFVTLNSPGTVGGVTFLADLVNDGSVSKSVVTWSNSDSADQFAGGRAAMLIGGSWEMPALDKSDVNYGIVTIPTPNAGEQVKVPVGGELWTVAVTADKPAAKAALECLTRDDHILTWAIARTNVPARTAVMDAFNEAVPEMKPFLDEMAGAVSRTSVLGTDYPRYSAAYAAALQAALVGSKSPQEALDEAHQTATAGQ